jgi:hypothetical protein
MLTTLAAVMVRVSAKLTLFVAHSKLINATAARALPHKHN